METLEQLLKRIEAHRKATNFEKFIWAIDPALNMGIRDFLVRKVDNHVVEVVDQIDTSMLIVLLMETDLIGDETLAQATRLNNAVRIALRTNLVRFLNEKYDGSQFEGLLRESEKTLEDADQFLDETEELIKTLLGLVKKN